VQSVSCIWITLLMGKLRSFSFVLQLIIIIITVFNMLTQQLNGKIIDSAQEDKVNTK
jgi:hypothetical protein